VALGSLINLEMALRRAWDCY